MPLSARPSSLRGPLTSPWPSKLCVLLWVDKNTLNTDPATDLGKLTFSGVCSVWGQLIILPPARNPDSTQEWQAHGVHSLNDGKQSCTVAPAQWFETSAGIMQIDPLTRQPQSQLDRCLSYGHTVQFGTSEIEHLVFVHLTSWRQNSGRSLAKFWAWHLSEWGEWDDIISFKIRAFLVWNQKVLYGWSTLWEEIGACVSFWGTMSN